MRESQRYLGLDLAGAKNQKTALAVLEYYPKEKKTFLLDIYDRIIAPKPQTTDEALLETIAEMKNGVAKMGINVPLALPPCITCTRKSCPLPSHCTVPAVKWMRELNRKLGRSTKKDLLKDFTPYTQRPIELWTRYQVLPRLPDGFGFEIDETMGGNKAPLSARMNFLARHLNGIALEEVWPKLSVSLIAQDLGLNKRIILNYRRLEQGIQAREEILEALVERRGVFIYERDIRKLSQSLASFDAFICAYTALLSDLGHCTKSPTGFPMGSGWVRFPRFEHKT